MKYVFPLVLLAGCATVPKTALEPIVVTKEVMVPVRVPCNPTLMSEPLYPDTTAALSSAPNAWEQVKLLVRGRILRIAREAELMTAIEGCAK